MKNVIVLGNGFIAQHLPYQKFVFRSRPDCQAIIDCIQKIKADVVINCLGATGRPNIDACEQTPIETYTANVSLPLVLAKECYRYGIRLIHLGSGCVFYGASPHTTTYVRDFGGWSLKDDGWQETDLTFPHSYYSRTKLATDLTIGTLPNVCILRLRMPVSPLLHPRNLLTKLLTYSQVVEVPNSITFTSDLMRAIDWAIEKEKSGIYHIASPTPLTHSELLEEYRKYVPFHTYTSISEAELDRMVVAKRSNCILDVSKSINEGFRYQDTYECLQETIKQYYGGGR